MLSVQPPISTVPSIGSPATGISVFMPATHAVTTSTSGVLRSMPLTVVVMPGMLPEVVVTTTGVPATSALRSAVAAPISACATVMTVAIIAGIAPVVPRATTAVTTGGTTKNSATATAETVGKTTEDITAV